VVCTLCRSKQLRANCFITIASTAKQCWRCLLLVVNAVAANNYKNLNRNFNVTRQKNTVLMIGKCKITASDGLSA